MATEIVILSQKHYKQWINDSSYSSDLSNYTNNLAAIVMQKIKIVSQIKIRTDVVAANAPNADPNNFEWKFTPIFPASSTNISITRTDGGDWTKENIISGDLVDLLIFSINFGNAIITGTVTVVSKNVIEFTSTSQSFPTDIIGAILVNKTPLKSLIWNFGLVENADVYDSKNLITDETQAWYSLAEIGTGSPRSTAFVNMQGLGIPKSWESGSCRARYLSTANYYQHFEIEHIFIIPFAGINEYRNLIDNVQPDYLDNNNSLKYVFEADFRTVLSNPNTSKKVKSENVLGSVGWFNETFNGFDSNYSIVSINYTDTGLNVSDGLMPNTTTITTVVIEKLVGNFGTDNVGVYFGYLPKLSPEVKNTVTNFDTNFEYDNIFATIGSAATVGGNIFTSLTATAVGNQLTLVINTIFSTSQQLKFTEGKEYILGFEVGDSSLGAGVSDAVILKEVKTFDNSTDIPDLMTLTAAYRGHTSYFATTGFTDFWGWNEHGLSIKGRITTDLTKQAFINAFSVKLIAYNLATGHYFEIDNYDFNLNNQTLSNSGNIYQLFSVNTTRNYPLPLGDEKNSVKLIFDNASIGTNTSAFDFEIAQKISWEDWIANSLVDNIFLDTTKEKDNKNVKTSNYSSLNGYEIKMLFDLDVTGISTLGLTGTTKYLYLSPNFRIYDYDEDGNGNPEFTQIIETFTADGLINLNGSVQVGNDTLMKITWTPKTALSSVSGFFGIHRIEYSGQNGKQLFELSTTETNLFGANFLKPITGFFLDMKIVSGNIVTSCLIDGTKTLTGISYNLSGEIRTPLNPADVEFFVKVTSDLGESKITSQSTGGWNNEIKLID